MHLRTIIAVLVLFIPIASMASEVQIAWDPSPTVGVTNYSVSVGTNSLASGSTNWVSYNVGTNLTLKIQLAKSRLYIHAKAWADGIVSDPSNELVVQPVEPPVGMRTMAVETIVDLRGTNWVEAGFFKIRLLP